MLESFTFTPYLIWLLVAIACLLVELLVFPTSGFLLCFAASAALMGGVSWVTEFTWTNMLGLFALFCFLSVIIWWVWLQKMHKVEASTPSLNDRTAQLIGYVGPLTEAIQGGSGRMAVNDTTWSVTAPTDLAAGTLVRVVEAKGIVLQVEPL